MYCTTKRKRLDHSAKCPGAANPSVHGAKTVVPSPRCQAPRHWRQGIPRNLRNRLMSSSQPPADRSHGNVSLVKPREQGPGLPIHGYPWVTSAALRARRGPRRRQPCRTAWLLDSRVIARGLRNLELRCALFFMPINPWRMSRSSE